MGTLVSIVFTSYNHSRYLKQALDSLINQSYKDIELIVVDDCSTDGSQEILQQYSSYPNVQLHLLKQNTGSYVKASNYGARLATGEYLMFAQCDDFAAPDQIQRLVNAFEQDSAIGVVYSRSNLVDADGIIFSDDFVGREKRFREICYRDTIIRGADMRRFLSFACVIPNLSAALIKRSLYTECNGLSEKYLVAADWAFWLDLSERTDFYYITAPLNNFRQHATTIRSKIKITTQIMEIYTIFYEHINRYNLTASDQNKMKVGAGAVWFWYFLENRKVWLQSFMQTLKRTFSIDKFSVYYLLLGSMVHIKEHFSAAKRKLA
ncbi:Glycosyl transferase family 2 [Chitinophaga rupis]|uniref:Glycosyl transferase family 2 n=1 Tax=Chitinophaga rupis TaxID=573321 RepID=A0A1H7LPZ4_9BACT|nr:glycosyltransferase [Chitinophaga rupis]SEL00919.1 Glycosyl transferase family 2 [Chitinophaga rupis]